MNRVPGIALALTLVFGIRPLLGQASVWIPAVQSPLYFAVVVRDVPSAVAWYSTALGLHESDRSAAPDGSWEIVNLQNEDFFVEVIRDARAQRVERSAGIGKVGFGVPDVETVAARIEQATGTRPRIVDVERHGLRILQIRDPEGNVLQIMSRLDHD